MKHTTPEIVDMPPEMREKLLAYRKEHANDPLGDVADRVIFEDDKVRIWDMKLEPGQFSALHRHDHSYYLLIHSGDYVAAVLPEGGPTDMYLCKIPPQGNTVMVRKGDTEWAYNAGKETYYEFLVELKNT